MNITLELTYLFIGICVISSIIYIYTDIIEYKSTVIETNKSIIRDINNDINNYNFINNTLKVQYIQLQKYIGTPDLIQLNNQNEIESISYMKSLKSDKLGKYNGFDVIKVNSNIVYSQHPQILFNNMIVGKYIFIPDHLYGPILYASSTLSIDQLNVPDKYNIHYKDTGKHKLVLLNCYCNSLVFGALTIHFIEKMIQKYKKNTDVSLKLNVIFKDEYDKIILNYIYNNTTNEIPWFKHENFGE